MADRKIYFATDIHGSEVCLRKFLNAGKFYGCDTLIMGGDITGKMIVPIVDRGQGVYTATLYGRNLQVTGDGLAKLRKTIDDARGDGALPRRPGRGDGTVRQADARDPRAVAGADRGAAGRHGDQVLLRA